MADVGVGHSLQQTSMPDPSPRGMPSGSGGTHSNLTCWPGGKNSGRFPSQDDVWEFTRRVWASFQVPKVRYHASKVDNNYSVPLVPHSLDRD